MDEEKPDTRHLVFKPKEITLTDARARPGDGSAITVQLIHEQNRLAKEKSKRMGNRGAVPASVSEAEPTLPPVFKPKEITPLDPVSHPDDEEAIRVPDILFQNRIAEEASGWGRLKRRRRRRSRRNRDFVLIVGGLDLTIAILIKVMGSPISMIFGIAAMTLITSMFTWTMFVVNDDY
jgi:hypothetical protein